MQTKSYYHIKFSVTTCEVMNIMKINQYQIYVWT
jgi:hypothetical protein